MHQAHLQDELDSWIVVHNNPASDGSDRQQARYEIESAHKQLVQLKLAIEFTGMKDFS